MKNFDLRKARIHKNDEFYTKMDVIQAELENYTHQFKGKIIYCNCDDYRFSNFFKYFKDNFKSLGLKKLIASCYKKQDDDLFARQDSDRALSAIYEGNEIKIHKLEGDGDFRGDESLKYLKKSDIIITNPPFSLFRYHVDQLKKYDKQFLLIGNVNAITYKKIFPLIRDNQLWLGPSISSGDRVFNVPDDYPLHASGCGIDEDGKRFIKVKGVRWFTNLDHFKRHKTLHLTKEYNEKDYPQYDNYAAIEVGKVKDIPFDYHGIMGVPITYLDKHNPDDFEIIGITDRANTSNLKTKIYDKSIGPHYSDLNGRATLKKDGILKSVYVRLLIQRKS